MNLRRRICSLGEADRVEGEERVPRRSHLGHGGAAAARRSASWLPSLRMRQPGDRGARRREGRRRRALARPVRSSRCARLAGGVRPEQIRAGGVSSRQSGEEDRVREENLEFQLILYYRDVMLTVGLSMDSQEQLDRVGRTKNNPYLSQIDIFHFFLSI